MFCPICTLSCECKAQLKQVPDHFSWQGYACVWTEDWCLYVLQSLFSLLYITLRTCSNRFWADPCMEATPVAGIRFDVQKSCSLMYWRQCWNTIWIEPNWKLVLCRLSDTVFEFAIAEECDVMNLGIVQMISYKRSMHARCSRRQYLQHAGIDMTGECWDLSEYIYLVDTWWILGVYLVDTCNAFRSPAVF